MRILVITIALLLLSINASAGVIRLKPEVSTAFRDGKAVVNAKVTNTGTEPLRFVNAAATLGTCSVDGTAHEILDRDELLVTAVAEPDQPRSSEESIEREEEGMAAPLEQYRPDELQSELLTHFEKEELEALVDMLQLRLSATATTASRLRQELEEWIRGRTTAFEQLKDPTVDGALIIAIRQVLLERHQHLPVAYREKLWQHGERVVDSIWQKEDRHTILAALLIIRSSGRDVSKELKERLAEDD